MLCLLLIIIVQINIYLINWASVSTQNIPKGEALAIINSVFKIAKADFSVQGCVSCLKF
ncbi:MAG: hypothetical protein NT091_03385 [Candidatus Falkowbacteria bacterium]|nr:hypothetical protein [Candidatus Falkowbacteria bacterium]